MQIINIIVLATISRILGGAWNNQIPRIYIILPLSLYVLFAIIPDLVQFGAIMYLFTIARILPTEAFLATCIDNKPPVRDDGRWNFLQRWTSLLWLKLPDRWQLWGVWGFLYGIVRNMLALPAILWLGGLAYLLLAQGLIYWLCGRAFKRNGSKVAEVVTGCIVGACI